MKSKLHANSIYCREHERVKLKKLFALFVVAIRYSCCLLSGHNFLLYIYIYFAIFNKKKKIYKNQPGNVISLLVSV